MADLERFSPYDVEKNDAGTLILKNVFNGEVVTEAEMAQRAEKYWQENRQSNSKKDSSKWFETAFDLGRLQLCKIKAGQELETELSSLARQRIEYNQRHNIPL